MSVRLKFLQNARKIILNRASGQLRLEDKLFNTVLELCGKPAERICRHFSIQVSDTTLLRLINRAPLPDSRVFTAIGVDDWAYKKRESMVVSWWI